MATRRTVHVALVHKEGRLVALEAESTAVWLLLRFAVLDSVEVAAVGRLARLLRLGGVTLALVEGGTVVHTRPLALLGLTVLELAGLVGTRRVPARAHLVVDVRAPVRSPAAPAGTEAVLVVAHEVVPLLELDPLALGALLVAGEHKTTDRVAGARGTVRVELATLVGRVDVHTVEAVSYTHLRAHET